MKKVISLFQRNYDGDRLVRDEVVPGAEWVLAGEGVATRKWDGTCCAVIGGKLYKRCEWDIKKGPAPPEWLHHDFDPAQRSGHGWLPVGIGPEDWMHRLAEVPSEDGTYELVGPKVQKNAEDREGYELIRHGNVIFHDCPRDFEGIREYLSERDIEGIVWHHPDGRMVKIKGRDFGIKRGARVAVTQGEL
jgi:hypothetical protein